MGINQADWHKRRITGGKKPSYRHKRKFEMGRQPAHTKWSPGVAPIVRNIRCRAGLIKKRALKLDSANVSWGSEGIARKTRIMGVVYNASDNDLVRTNTLVKGAVITVDSSRFREWYEQYYGVTLGGKKKGPSKTDASTTETEKKEEAEKPAAEATPATTAPATDAAGADKKGGDKKPAADKTKKKASKTKISSRQKKRLLESGLEDQFNTGRLLVIITSRPGQCGRCDGYVLEGKELEFYQKKMQKKR